MTRYSTAILLIITFAFVVCAEVVDQQKLLFEKQLTTSSGETLYVEAQSGHVEIITWNKNEAEIKIYGNDEYEEKFTFLAEKISDGIKIIVKKKDSDDEVHNTNGKISVKVPSTYNTDVETMGGHISVESRLEGDIKLETFGGHISFEEGEGELDLNTKGGHISVESFDGKTTLNTMGGHISVDRSTGDLFAKTMGGNISLSAKDGEVDAETMGGSVKCDYEGENKGISLSTMGGSITLTVPEDIEADVYLKTASGHVHSDFPGNYEKKTRFKAETNGGGPSITCKSFGGNVSLQK